MAIKAIDTKTLKEWIKAGEVILIDVREPAEHAALKIDDAELHPLGSLCCSNLIKAKKKIVVHCQKGARGLKACEKLLAEEPSLEIYNLEGGIEAWQNSGGKVKATERFFLPLDRQVQLTIGLFVLIMSLAAYFVDTKFAFVSAFFGAGLVFAALSGFCGLALLMARMPWNKI